MMIKASAEDSSARVPYDVAATSGAPVVPWAASTPYERWCDAQGIPIVRGFHVPDVAAVPTGHWRARGVDGCIICLDGTDATNGSYILKFGEGTQSHWLRHLYEEVFYVVSGQGVTEVETGGAISTCRWGSGSLFAPPLNTQYRHVALTDAVLYCVHSAPPVLNLFHSDRFVEANGFVFEDRFAPGEDYFSPRGTLWQREDGAVVWETTLVEDVRTFELPALGRRGGSGQMATFQLGEGSLIAHISQFAVGSYKKAHRHGPGANIMILDGEGFSLLWARDRDEPTRVDWRPGSIFSPPDMWWHQHFNTGTTPVRYVAIRWGSRKHLISHAYEGTTMDRRDGGNQIEYDDQDPAIDALFRQELARRGPVGNDS